MNRDDIEGAKARKSDKQGREIMKVDDIDGAKPMIPYLAKERKNKLNSLDYRDVTAKKTHQRRFSTNPLNPDYRSNGD